MQFSKALISAVAFCLATLVSSSPIPIAQPEAAQPVAREADPQACRLINSCI
ncbi:hypothetical protein DFP72DRAFT_1066732 [Ephemerocybe angulata]|uniref:Uncharacterized protein n=1 Tax=Ephemerocybe angulata TaxID=980116 RepID=A0A8H6I2V4_9AGAR|nr:hypothetical protein DFP72DRAFT_1066732 [Tulosesus angulatus]